MARSKKTPGDELAEVQAKIDALVKEGEDLSARRGDAEALLRSYPDRREHALRLQKLGEKVELPDEAEQARLQRFVADAKSEEDAVLWARRQREGVRMKVLAAGLPHFDAAGEESARALEAEGEALLAALAAFQAAQQRKNEAWRRSYDGRHELRVDQMPAVGPGDLGHLGGEIKEAIRTAWPALSEKAWLDFKAREQAAPAPKLTNAEVRARFEVIS